MPCIISLLLYTGAIDCLSVGSQLCFSFAATFPLPIVQIRRFTLWVTDKVLFMRLNLFGVVNTSMYALMLGLAGLIFGGAWWDMNRAHNDYNLAKRFGRVDEAGLVRKFRSERNWWLALFALTLWVIILRVRHMQESLKQKDERIAVLQQVRQAIPAAAVAAPAAAAPAPAAAAAAAASPRVQPPGEPLVGSPGGDYGLKQRHVATAAVAAPSAPAARAPSPSRHTAGEADTKKTT